MFYKDHIQQIRKKPENLDDPEVPKKCRYTPYSYLHLNIILIHVS